MFLRYKRKFSKLKRKLPVFGSYVATCDCPGCTLPQIVFYRYHIDTVSGHDASP